MDVEDGPEPTRKRRRKPVEDGIYVLRSMVKDIPLAPEECATAPRITCVELWGQ